MNFNVHLRRLDTEKETELDTVRECTRVIDLEIGTAMREVHHFQSAILRLSQEKADLKDEEDQIHSRYQKRPDELNEIKKGNFVNVRRQQALKSKSLNLTHLWPGKSQRLHVSRRSSGVF